MNVIVVLRFGLRTQPVPQHPGLFRAPLLLLHSRFFVSSPKGLLKAAGPTFFSGPPVFFFPNKGSGVGQSGLFYLFILLSSGGLVKITLKLTTFPRSVSCRVSI